MLIVMVGVMTLVFVVGAIAVDIGLWVSERRGAQTDADFIALTGAWELIDPGASEADAIAAANAALTGNDEQLNADIANIDVDLTERCVSVDVSHDSSRLFSALFGLSTDPEIGAHAKACAGAALAPGNLVPFQIDNNPGPCFDTSEEPIFTSMCPLELGAQSSNPRGMLDLDASEDYCSEAGGSGNIEDLIVNGAPGICLINETGTCSPANGGPWYDCAAVQTGNPKKVLDGVAARLANEGACDANGDGVEDFLETVELVFDTGDPTTGIYEARDCDPSTDGKQISWRLVSLIVFEEPPPKNAGNTGFPIDSIAGFYLAGCAPESVVVDDESDLDRDCTGDYDTARIPGGDLYVMSGNPAPLVGHCGAPGIGHGGGPPGPCPPGPGPGPGGGAPGHAVVYGRFVNLIAPSGDIGDPTDQTTLFGIALVE